MTINTLFTSILDSYIILSLFHFFYWKFVFITLIFAVALRDVPLKVAFLLSCLCFLYSFGLMSVLNPQSFDFNDGFLPLSPTCSNNAYFAFFGSYVCKNPPQRSFIVNIVDHYCATFSSFRNLSGK